MKLHEYQAKELLARFDLPVGTGIVIETAEGVLEKTKSLGSGMKVVKAQVHAGGRGKAGGVKLAKTDEELEAITQEMMGKKLVTPQTGEEGVIVKKIFITPGVDIETELYAAVTLDRMASLPLLMVSREGGVEIETLAKTNPEKIFKIHFSPSDGLDVENAKEIAGRLGFNEESTNQLADVFQKLAKAFLELDASLVEVNPLILLPGGAPYLLDAKIALDDSSLFRHEDLSKLRDTDEEDPRELEAAQWDLSYVGLDGNIGCMVNGAGLAMATMDIIKFYGGEPANFLDVGGGATKEKVREAFKLILSDKRVKGVLVNIFGGIMRCDIIAQGIIDAVKEIDLKLPLVVRLEGTKVKEGKALLAASGIKLTPASSFSEAAKKIVEYTKG